MDKYTILKRISDGACGSTYLATTNELFRATKRVIKIVENPNMSLHEVEILRDLVGVPGVVQYIEDFRSPSGELVIVTEYTPGIELYEYIVRNGPLDSETAKIIMRQLCKIVQQVHDAGIVHRDLKPENILINKETLQIAILDWGLAFYPDRTEERRACGSPHYAPPEVIERPAKYNGPELDVWALGVIYYSLLTAALPINADNLGELFSKTLALDIDYSRRELSPRAKNVLKQVLVHRQDRITLQQFGLLL